MVGGATAGNCQPLRLSPCWNVWLIECKSSCGRSTPAHCRNKR